MSYRLLKTGEPIEIGDECLNEDDCETWDKENYASKEANGRWFLGVPFNPYLMVPHRRKETP